MKRPRIREDDIEKQIRDFLKVALPSEVICFHIPNGSQLGARQVWQMKNAGMVAGIPDRCFLYRGRAYFIEVKGPRGRLTESQEAMFPKIRECGCPVAVCRSADDVQKALDSWGIPLRSRMLPLNDMRKAGAL